jgi:heat shock protein HslJ
MKKQMLNSGLAGAFWCGLAACAQGGAAPNQAQWSLQNLLGSRWVQPAVPGGQSSVSLDIADDGGMSGSLGCNRYIGKAEVAGTSVRLIQVGSTRMFCFPQEHMDTERRFSAALEQTRSAKKEQGFLLLLDEAGNVLWRLKPRD